MTRHFFSLGLFFACIIILLSCDKNEDVGKESTAVTSVSLSNTAISIGIDATYTLSATIQPTDATDTLVTWTSDDTSIATVADGVVTGVAEGTTTVTVTTDDGSFTATCSVTVSEDASGSVSSGYVLFSFLSSYTTQLIDTSGETVKSWTSDYASGGSSYLSSNLTLLRGGNPSSLSSSAFANGGGVTGLIEELDDNSNVVWSYESATDEATLHHDFKEIDENTIIALAWELITVNGNEVWNDNIIIIDKETNTVTWEWSAYDDGGLTPSGSTKDFIHFNSVVYKNDTILVSSYEKNTLYEIDKDSKEILATYTAGGKLDNQHDATYLDNGNILVFNNKASNNKSAVYEIDSNDDIVWEYSNDFYTGTMGGTQRLSGGNTFICTGTEGSFIEVTSDGEEVWNYTPKSSTASYGIFRARKYTSY